jgi:ribA/ribD-fused uncharacterized protein
MNTALPKTHSELVEAMQKGWRPKWAFFWGHTPSKDGSATKAAFSQWWAGHPFEVDGIRYATAEHYMMAEKARLFHDEATLSKIIGARSPAIAKKLGRQVANFDDQIWRQHRYDIVVRGNRAKFSKHVELKTFLLQTGDRLLVEASPFDRIWGIGMAATDPNAEKPQFWKGLNLLGFALMEVREEFQQTTR